MTRIVLAAGCALLSPPAWAQGVKLLAGCSSRPAECQINVQVFDFGRGQMSPSSPAINGHNTISVTCTRAPQADKRDVDIHYQLKAVPAEPARQMRDSHLGYLRYFMYVDAARTRYWGDGISHGTATLQGSLFLDDRNKVGTIVHQVYGKVDAGQTALAGQWLGLVATRLEYDVSCR